MMRVRIASPEMLPLDDMLPHVICSPAGASMGPATQRDRHLAMITERGQLAWQLATDDGQRSLVETTMGRSKTLIGCRLRAHGFASQQTEAATEQRP